VTAFIKTKQQRQKKTQKIGLQKLTWNYIL